MPPGSSKSRSSSRESSISKEQARILGHRDAVWRNYYQPILQKELRQTSDGHTLSQFADHAVGAVNQDYQQAKENLVRSLGQREVEGGFRNSALAGLEVARANAATGAKADAFARTKQHQTNLLSLAGGMSPKPTSAVAYHQDNKTKSGLGMFL